MQKLQGERSRKVNGGRVGHRKKTSKEVNIEEEEEETDNGKRQKKNHEDK